MTTTVIMVALGGALGSVLRFFVGTALAFPYGTLAVNLGGSMAIGLVWVWCNARGFQDALPFLMAGVLGGFTTFSAFSLDTLRLIEAGRIAAAGGYVLASVAGSILACALGAWLAKGWTA